MTSITPSSVSIVNNGGTPDTFGLSFNFGTIANSGTTTSITLQPSTANPQGFDLVMNYGTSTFEQSTVLSVTLNSNSLIQQNGTLDVNSKTAWDLPIASVTPTSVLINDQGSASTATPLGNLSLLCSVAKGGRNIIIDPIINPVANTVFAVTGTLTNYSGLASISLTYADNNTVYSSAGNVTLTNGTGTFNIAHPALLGGETASVCILDANGLMAISNNFTVGIAPSIVWYLPASIIAGYTYNATADITDGPIVFKINTNNTDGSVVHHFQSGMTADPVNATGATGSFNFFPGHDTGYLHAFAGTTGSGASLGLSAAIPIIQPFVINTITNQVSGTPFILSGTYASNSLNSIDYSLDGGVHWVTVPGISGNTFSISITEPIAGTSKFILIQDTAVGVNTIKISNFFDVT